MSTICLSYLEGEGNMGKSSILNCFKLAAQQGWRTDISLEDHLLVHCASEKNDVEIIIVIGYRSLFLEGSPNKTAFSGNPKPTPCT
jgi:hypothetical protein